MKESIRRFFAAITCVIIAITFIVSDMSTVLASSNNWYDKYVAWESTIGTGTDIIRTNVWRIWRF